MSAMRILFNFFATHFVLFFALLFAVQFLRRTTPAQRPAREAREAREVPAERPEPTPVDLNKLYREYQADPGLPHYEL